VSAAGRPLSRSVAIAAPALGALAAVAQAGGFWALLSTSACDVGQGPSTGIGEPMQVQNGQFISGDLPGTPPPTADAGPPATDAGTPPLSVLTYSFVSTIVVPGAGAKNIGGDVTDDAVAVGARLVDQGSGYWVVPAGMKDLMVADARTFSMSMAFQPSDVSGLHDLRFVALGPDGTGGQQSDLEVCFEPRIPDNGHACDPTVAPPRAVFSLQWDTNFDLDLHVISPSGVDYNPKNPLGEPLEAGVRTVPGDAPFVDRDSLRGCAADGLRQEDVVFPISLPSGRYHIYVDPFAACGQNQVHFTFTLYESSGTCPNCNLVAASPPVSGELLASQVTGGTAPALFVQDIVVK
jgi:hypothetical protein